MNGYCLRILSFPPFPRKGAHHLFSGVFPHVLLFWFLFKISAKLCLLKLIQVIPAVYHWLGAGGGGGRGFMLYRPGLISKLNSNRSRMRQSGGFLWRHNLSWNKSVIFVWKVFYAEKKYGDLSAWGGKKGMFPAGPLQRVFSFFLGCGLPACAVEPIWFVTACRKKNVLKTPTIFNVFFSWPQTQLSSGCFLESIISYTGLPSCGGAWKILQRRYINIHFTQNIHSKHSNKE